MKFFLKLEELTFTYKTILNFYIVYDINSRSLDLENNFTLGNSLFSSAKLTLISILILDLLLLNLMHVDLFRSQRIVGLART